jgi:choline dehydrogenase
MPIPPFHSQLPVRISFGDGAVSELEELLGGRRAFVVVEEPVAGIPAVAEVLEHLSAAEVVRKPSGEPKLADVDDVAARIERARPEVVAAIGGGSAIDLAKAARQSAVQGEPFARFCRGEVAVVQPTIDLVAVPTTSGTGSDVSGAAVAYDPDQGRKVGFATPLMRAQHSLVDPLLTVGLPRDATVFAGVDALAQAIDGVIVSNSNPLSAAMGLEAVRHLVAGLEPAAKDGSDLDARRSLSLGSLMAGLAMNLSDCGADHALGHAIGSLLGLPHGLTVGLVLAESLDVNRDACAEALERVADAMDEPRDGSTDGSRAVRAVRNLLARLEFPTAAGAGVSQQHVDRLVDLALQDYCLTVNPRPWAAGDIRHAYGEALAVSAR